jgi:DNA invertase Pin-like site-specific DNA recombinase
MTNAFVYNRVSTTEQNPELQLKECLDYATERGWTVKQVFSEQKSAFKDESKRDEFNRMLDETKQGGIDFILVWNMDRFSRQPEEYVMKQIRDLSFYGTKVVAVHGDVWSQLVESIGRLKELGSIGEAILEFLEKIIRALEYQRANRESKTKSERVKMAVRHVGGRTESYKGNKWGRKGVPKQTRDRVLELHKQGLSTRKIAALVRYTLNGKERQLSRGTVHKIVSEKPPMENDVEKSNDGQVQKECNL